METCVCRHSGKDGTQQHSGRLVRVGTAPPYPTDAVWVCGNHIDAYLRNLAAATGENLLAGHFRGLGDPAALRQTERSEQETPDLR